MQNHPKLYWNHENVIVRSILSKKAIVCQNPVFSEMTKIQHTFGLLGKYIAIQKKINPENGGDVRACHHENGEKVVFFGFFFVSFWKGQRNWNLPNFGKYLQLGNREASWDLQDTSLES